MGRRYTVLITTDIPFMLHRLLLLVITFAFLGFSFEARAEGVNLIQNPSVENGTATPTAWFKGGWGSNARLLEYPVPGVDGVRAVKVTVSNFVSGDAKWFGADVPVVPGKQYIVRNKYQSSVATQVAVRFLRSNGTYVYVSAGSAPASVSWRQFAGTTTAPVDAVSATIFHVLAGNGTLSTDAYELREVGALPPPPPPPPPSQGTTTHVINMIPNAGVESVAAAGGRPDKWQKGGWGTNNRTFTYPVAGNNGGSAAQVSMSTFSSGDAKWYFDPVSVTPGLEYEFRNEYKSTTQTEIVARFGLQNGSFQYVYLGAVPASPTMWSMFTKKMVAPALATTLTVFHVLGGVGSLTVDNYVLRPAATTTQSSALLSLTFDDAYLSQYLKAVPILDAANIDATFYITTGRVGTDAARYMTWNQILTMASNGHEIGGHTRSHPSLPTLTRDEQFAEIRGSYDDIVAQGLTPRTFAYPFGDHTPAVQAVVAEAGFKGARGVTRGYNDATANKLALQDQHIESDVTLAEVKGYIDYAIANNKWLILELHHQEDVTTNQYSNTPQLLQGIVAYIAEKKIETVTLSDGFDRVFGK